MFSDKYGADTIKMTRVNDIISVVVFNDGFIQFSVHITNTYKHIIHIYV